VCALTLLLQDADGNGTLDRDEVAPLAEWALTSLLESTKAVRMTQEQKETEADKLMQAADTNGDGVVDFDEFVGWFTPTAAKIQEHQRKQEQKKRQRQAQKAARAVRPTAAQTEAAAEMDPSYYVWDVETAAHVGPFSRLEMITKGYPTDTLVCLGDGNGGFGEWQDVTELITPPDELPREEDTYRELGRTGRCSSLTRQQSAEAAALLFKQSSRNVKAQSAAERVVGCPKTTPAVTPVPATQSVDQQAIELKQRLAEENADLSETTGAENDGSTDEEEEDAAAAAPLEPAPTTSSGGGSEAGLAVTATTPDAYEGELSAQVKRDVESMVAHVKKFGGAGGKYERMAKEQQKDNPQYGFLWPGGTGHAYYQKLVATSP
jgi:hypothetical protein